MWRVSLNAIFMYVNIHGTSIALDILYISLHFENKKKRFEPSWKANSNSNLIVFLSIHLRCIILNYFSWYLLNFLT